MTLIDILLVILIILAAALIIFLFGTLKKLNRSIDVLSADVHQLIDSTIPVMDNLNRASEKLANVAGDAEDYMNEFNSFVNGAKVKLTELSSKVKEETAKNPIFNLVHNLNAFSKGISAFWSKYTNNH